MRGYGAAGSPVDGYGLRFRFVLRLAAVCSPHYTAYHTVTYHRYYPVICYWFLPFRSGLAPAIASCYPHLRSSPIPALPFTTFSSVRAAIMGLRIGCGLRILPLIYYSYALVVTFSTTLPLGLLLYRCALTQFCASTAYTTFLAPTHFLPLGSPI